MDWKAGPEAVGTVVSGESIGNGLALGVSGATPVPPEPVTAPPVDPPPDPSIAFVPPRKYETCVDPPAVVTVSVASAPLTWNPSGVVVAWALMPNASARRLTSAMSTACAVHRYTSACEPRSGSGPSSTYVVGRTGYKSESAAALGPSAFVSASFGGVEGRVDADCCEPADPHPPATSATSAIIELRPIRVVILGPLRAVVTLTAAGPPKFPARGL